MNYLAHTSGSPLASSAVKRTIRYRSVWISDLHLGTRACKAAALLDFLRHHRAENLYLVGDIVDGWSVGRSWYWSKQQNAIAREIVKWKRDGAKVVFTPGNHDEGSLDLIRLLFGDIPVLPEVLHETAEGRRMVVTHGHQFDTPRRSANWLSAVGGSAYTVALRISEWQLRERFNLSEGALSGYFKRPVKKAVERLTESDVHEVAVLRTVKAKNADGIICGHTHRPEQRLIDSIWYINDGDWVHSCTALAEHDDGLLRLMRWIPKTSVQAPRQEPSLEA